MQPIYLTFMIPGFVLISSAYVPTLGEAVTTPDWFDTELIDAQMGETSTMNDCIAHGTSGWQGLVGRWEADRGTRLELNGIGIIE